LPGEAGQRLKTMASVSSKGVAGEDGADLIRLLEARTGLAVEGRRDAPRGVAGPRPERLVGAELEPREGRAHEQGWIFGAECARDRATAPGHGLVAPR